MTIDLAATDFALAITHDLCDHSDQSYVLSATTATSRTFFLRFTHDYNIFRPQVGRDLVVSPV